MEDLVWLGKSTMSRKFLKRLVLPVGPNALIQRRVWCSSLMVLEQQVSKLPLTFTAMDGSIH